MPIRIVLAEDHPIVLQGLTHLFGRYPEFQVIRGCVTGDEALAAVREAQPDVLVLDNRMPGPSGIDVLRVISQEKLRSRVVIWTAYLDENEVVEAMTLGAKGIVLKESAADTLLECVRNVHQGGVWYDPPTVTRALDRVVRREAGIREVSAVLTPREIQVVGLVAEGLRNREIAERLLISEGTVKIHLHNMYEKLALTGRLELVLYAQEKGLV